MFKYNLFLFSSTIIILLSCNNNAAKNTHSYDEDVLSSVITCTDSLLTFDFVANNVLQIKAAMAATIPILLCGDSLNEQQKVAQQIAISDPTFTQFIKNKDNNNPYRNEIFAVYPARASDMGNIKNATQANCYKVEMYNYTLNLTSIGIVI